MAGEQNVGSIVYDISADVSNLLQGSKEAIKILGDLDGSAQKSGKGLGALDKNADSAGDALNALNGYSRSIDGSLNKLNTTVNGIARAMLEARKGTSGAGSEFTRAESIIESLGNQLAILEEAEQASARSAAILAAQLPTIPISRQGASSHVVATHLKPASESPSRAQCLWSLPMPAAPHLPATRPRPAVIRILDLSQISLIYR